MPRQSAARARGIDTVFDELSAITRRVTARTRRSASPLSFVEHSLLSFIGQSRSCRATDIAASFHLNRSTVSRQLAGLLELGLVEYDTTADASQRGRVLRITPHGRRQLDDSAKVQRAALLERLASWSDADIQTLATLLGRFNEGETRA